MSLYSDLRMDSPVEDELLVVPSPRSDFVELSRSPQGRLFKKHLLTKGNLIHPETGSNITIDDQFFNTMITNFKNNVCDIVQVPLANKNNDHDESPDRNIGEVVGLEEKDDKLYAIIDFRKHAEDVGSTLLGTSALFSQNYKDARTGLRVGPTLLHTAVTNRPYVTGLEDYEEIVAASNANRGTTVFLTANQENDKMDLQEILTALKDDHGIDVAELQKSATSADAKAAEAATASLAAKEAVAEAERATQEAASAIALSNTLKEKLASSGFVKLSNGSEVSTDDIVGAVAQVAGDYVALSARMAEVEAGNEALRTEKATAQVDQLVSSGHILPAKRDTMLNVKLSNPELFDQLVSADDEPLVKLSNERGSSLSAPSTREQDTAAIEQYANLAKSMGLAK